jgi:hypothetical protein
MVLVTAPMEMKDAFVLFIVLAYGGNIISSEGTAVIPEQHFLLRCD